jgi:hypothetical protein
MRETRLRDPANRRIFVVYLILYLATTMAYWWPLGHFSPTLWYVYGTLFLASLVLNITSP